MKLSIDELYKKLHTYIWTTLKYDLYWKIGMGNMISSEQLDYAVNFYNTHKKEIDEICLPNNSNEYKNKQEDNQSKDTNNTRVRRSKDLVQD